MSTFADKIHKGILPSDKDWETHLIQAHALEPRMTPAAYAGFRTNEGLNSYEILANQLPVPPRDFAVVDLACGEGHLIPYLLARLGSNSKISGVDISQEGIELAKAQIRDPRVNFTLARAQTLPFESHSIDHIFCHMALMLMSPAAPVVTEIRRVLKPGGIFSAVVNGGTRVGLYREIHRLTSLFVQAHLPRLMDSRTGKGLHGLFADGFAAASVSMNEIQLRYHVPPEGIWDYLRSMYFLPMLSEPARRELKDELMRLAQDHRDSDRKILFYVPLTCLLARTAAVSN